LIKVFVLDVVFEVVEAPAVVAVLIEDGVDVLVELLVTITDVGLEVALLKELEVLIAVLGDVEM